MLPAWRDPTGRGSRGRGLDEPSILAAIAGDLAATRERAALGDYLRGAYRDPAAARAALGEAVGREGWRQAGQEIARDPARFGELRGKTGWLASAASKEERAGAERAVHAVPDSLRRIHATTEAAHQATEQTLTGECGRRANGPRCLSTKAATRCSGRASGASSRPGWTRWYAVLPRPATA